MNRCFPLFVLAILLPLGGCSFLDGLLNRPAASSGHAVPLAERPVSEPQDPNRFVIDAPGDTLVGEPQIVIVQGEDTFSDLARTYGLGYDELIDANPGINPWLPGEGTAVLLPTQYVLPEGPHKGIVLNIAAKRLFFFTHEKDADGPTTRQVVLTYPIGIGRSGWETPVGSTKVVSKAVNPTWYVPASVRAEHAANGDPLPSIVPPGPDNPLGTRALKLGIPGYLIHGTNQPYGVGMRVSHGCVRLYPENIEFLYPLVKVGETVTIVNQPYLIGRRAGNTYLESHRPLEDDAKAADKQLQALLEGWAVDSKGREGQAGLTDKDRQQALSIASDAKGVPVRIRAFDVDEVLVRARVVRNTVKQDPNAPSLEEVHALLDADREAVRNEGSTP